MAARTSSCHISILQAAGLTDLPEGQPVNMRVVETPKGPRGHLGRSDPLAAQPVRANPTGENNAADGAPTPSAASLTPYPLRRSRRRRHLSAENNPALPRHFISLLFLYLWQPSLKLTLSRAAGAVVREDGMVHRTLQQLRAIATSAFVMLTLSVAVRPVWRAWPAGGPIARAWKRPSRMRATPSISSTNMPGTAWTTM